MAFLQAQMHGLKDGILLLHSLASRIFLLLVDQLRQPGQRQAPLVDTAVLLAPANGRYIADWVPEVAAFFTQDLWVPCLTGAARRLLIAAANDDPYWEEAAQDLEQLCQQPGVEVLLLPGQGHLNQADVSGHLPEVLAWILQAKPCYNTSD
jgi:predicted alpha/beta hydrolase family esterase